MCISCLLFSTLTLFLPASEPANFNPDVVVNSSSSEMVEITAKDSQSAIASLLDELPDTPELAILRQELRSLQSQLATAKNNAEVETMLDDGLKIVSQRVLAAPDADKAIDALMAMMVIEESSSSAKMLSFKMLQNNSFNPQAPTQKTWGWLH